MTVWLISANPKRYKHSAAFAKWGYIDWMQFANYDVGDIVYIYSSKQDAIIRYKTVVTRNNMAFSEIDEEDSFWLEKPSPKRQEMNFIRLKLIKRLDNYKLKLAFLKQNGLKNAPQRPMVLSGDLLSYIENNE